MPTLYTSDYHLFFIPKELRTAFLEKVDAIARYLQINPDWLMSVFWHESGMDPQALGPMVDSNGKVIAFAVGLNQFIPSTAKSFGATSEMLYDMNALKQLDYVMLYFEPYRGKINTFTELMTINFLPAALPLMNNPNNVIEVKGLSASIIAKNNPAFDKNKDGKITVEEYTGHLRQFFGKVVDSPNPNKGINAPKPPYTKYIPSGKTWNLFDERKKYLARRGTRKGVPPTVSNYDVQLPLAMYPQMDDGDEKKNFA